MGNGCITAECPFNRFRGMEDYSLIIISDILSKKVYFTDV